MMLDALTLVINCRLTGADLEKMIFIFPTQTYSLISGLIPL
jgi:glutathione reductase (NADPH)